MEEEDVTNSAVPFFLTQSKFAESRSRKREGEREEQIERARRNLSMYARGKGKHTGSVGVPLRHSLRSGVRQGWQRNIAASWRMLCCTDRRLGSCSSLTSVSLFFVLMSSASFSFDRRPLSDLDGHENRPSFTSAGSETRNKYLAVAMRSAPSCDE